MRRALPLLVLLAAGLAPGAGRALDPIRLEPGLASVEVGPHAGFLLDESGKLGPEEVLAAARAGRLERVGGSARRFGTTRAALWLHVPLQGSNERAWRLTWEQPLVDRLDAWLIGPGRSERRTGGLLVPEAERTFLDRGPFWTAPLSLEDGERADLLVRVESSRPLLPSATLWREAALLRRDILLAAAVGLCFGLLLTVVLLGLYSWRALGDPWGLRFSAMLAAYGAYQLAVSGIGPAWLWTGWPGFSVAAPGPLACLTASLALAYVRSFLDSAGRHRRIDRSARIFQWLALVAGAVTLAGPRTAVYIGTGVWVVTFAHWLALALASSRQGDPDARRLLSTWNLVALGGMVYAASLLGWIPYNAFTGTLVQAAIVLGALLMVFSQVNRVEAERQGTRASLERLADERTRTLRDTIDRLQVEVLQREKAEQQRTESEDRFRVAFFTSPDAIAITQITDGRYLAINQGFTRLTGYTEGELLGRSSTELNIWADPADRERLVAGLRATGTVENLEAGFRYKDGGVRTGLMSARVIQLGGVAHLLSITRDISERLAAESDRARLVEELRQAQKLEAIGRLAGGVAHDFNNLLTAITANASLALMDLPDGDPTREPLQEIDDAAHRAAGLTRQLLAFSRRQVLEPQPLDLSAHVQGMGSMLRRILGEDVELVYELATDLQPVMADPGQVEQVVVNLAANARDALPDGGRIVIATEPFQIEVEEPPEPGRGAPGEGARRAGRYGAVVVRDQGAGIPPEVLPHVFEPFFSTKGGRGTGLGLATVYGVARQHGGFVEVDSAPGQGTTIRVAFPVAAGPALPVAVARPAGAMARGHETVLLVEDEPAVREATQSLLQRLGYRVLVAGDAAEAMRVAAAHGSDIQLLLTDVVMPGENGRDLADRLRQRLPGLVVIFMSGYTQDVISRAGVMEDGLVLVQKPFEPHRLAAVLREALDDRVPTRAGPVL